MEKREIVIAMWSVNNKTQILVYTLSGDGQLMTTLMLSVWLWEEDWTMRFQVHVKNFYGH